MSNDRLTGEPPKDITLPQYSTSDLVRLPFIQGENLQPGRINLINLASEFTAAGFNLNLSKNQRLALSQPQFRDYQSQRGIAMAAFLGDHQDDFEQMIQVVCADYKRSIKGDKTRGARQLAADLVAAAAGVIDREQLAQKINQRAAKTRGEITGPVNGLPPQAAVRVIGFLTGN